MTITLDDVSMLFGISIDGDACECGDQAVEEAMPIMTELYGWDAQELRSWSIYGGVPNHILYAKLKVLATGELPAEGMSRSRVATLWLAALLSSTLFLNKTTNKVDMKLLALTLDHQRTGGFAWGAGALACLYRGLGEASRAKAAKIDVALALLQVINSLQLIFFLFIIANSIIMYVH